MAEEHHEIDPVLVSCSAAFSRLASSPDVRIHEQLVADIAEFGDLVHAHLAHEETDALAIVQQYLSVEEWKAFEAEIGKDYKPWEIPFALCWVLKGLPDDAREGVFSLSGRAAAAGVEPAASRLRPTGAAGVSVRGRLTQTRAPSQR